MSQINSFFKKKISGKPYLLINIIFAFFPISLILGSFIVNLNLVLFCCFGIYYLRSKILNNKLDFPIKLIFLFFLVIFFSTTLSFIKTLYLQGYNSIDVVPFCYNTNCYSPIEKLIKSILFFRFFLFLLIVYLTNKSGILNFRYFFLTTALASVSLSLDIIFQYIFGFDILGNKPSDFYYSGFFGDEFIAGGYIQRFAFFAIFFTMILFKNKNYIKYIAPISIIYVLAAGILFAGNRIPLVLFIFGLLLILLLKIKIKKILFLSLVGMFILLKLITWSDQKYNDFFKGSYWSFFNQTKTLFNPGIRDWQRTARWDWEGWQKKNEEPNSEMFIGQKTNFYTVKYEDYHKRIFLAAIETWKFNKIFGNGLKSFRDVCWKLAEQPDISLSEELWPNKKNLLCSNHPHNYYLEILTETGIAGLVLILIIALSFIVFIFKNYRPINSIRFENFILLSAIISLILEALPLRSTGSLFTTNNTTYLILISSIILCHKTLLEINKSK